MAISATAAETHFLWTRTTLVEKEAGKEEWILKHRREILHHEILEKVITPTKMLLTSVSEGLIALCHDPEYQL